MQQLGAVSSIIHVVPLYFLICTHFFSVVLRVVLPETSQAKTWNLSFHLLLAKYSAAVTRDDDSLGYGITGGTVVSALFPQTHLYLMLPMAPHMWTERR